MFFYSLKWKLEFIKNWLGYKNSWIKFHYLDVIFRLEADDQGLCHFVVPLVAHVAVVLVVDSVVRRALKNEVSIRLID
jgi:hypothetical protein